MRSFILAGGLVVGLAGTFVLAQQSPAPNSPQPQPQPTFAAGGTAVVVDAVVRDKGGKPITDLKAADFELLEDGVPQTIGDVALVAPPPSSETPSANLPASVAAAPNVSSRPVVAPTFVALVFDRLSPEARSLATKGAMSYLDTSRDNDFAGVFVVDNALQTIQTYTSDRTALKQAIDEAATRATAKFDRNNDRVRSARFGDGNPSTSLTASAEEAGPALGATASNPGGTSANVPAPGQGQSASAGGFSDAALVKVMNRMDRSYEAMMRDEQGYATTNGLLA